MFRIALTLQTLAVVTLGAAAAGSSGAGGVLSGLSIAAFPGSGSTSVQATATDPSGNIYVAGTTSSADLAVKNAAQPFFGDAAILRSTDLGITWTHVGNPPAPVTAVVPDPVDPQVIFAQGTTGIFKSTDGGQTWKPVYSLPSAALVIDPGNHMRLAALASSGTLIRSLDGGATWSNGGPTCQLSSCGASSLIADPTGSGALIAQTAGISVSKDWGLTFQPLVPLGIGSPSSAAFDPSHPGWIYADRMAGVMGQLSLSTDFGVTWTSKGSPPTIFSAIISMQVDPDQPNILIAATADGLYKSSDGATTWTAQSRSGSFLVNTHEPILLVSHKCSPTGGLFATGSAGAGSFQVAFSSDYGITWNTPQLSGIINLALGAGCSAYVARPTTTDAFVSKISPDGTVQWTTFLGGSDQDSALALAVDSLGNAYVTGVTSSQDFPATIARIGIVGVNSIFITRFSTDGKITFSTLIGGENIHTASAIAVDLSQNIYVSGYTDSSQFPVTPGALLTTADKGEYTGFATKLTPSGTVAYSTFLGTPNTYPRAMLVDPNNQLVITGTGPVPSLPVPPAGNSPSFIMKLNSTGTQITSSAYLPTLNPSATPTALAVDANGKLLVYGTTVSPTFMATPGAYSSPPILSSCTLFPNYLFGQNAFLLKLDSSTYETTYGALLSAPCGISSDTMTLDSSGAIILAMTTGQGLSLVQPFLAGPNCGGNSSAVAKLSPDGSTLQFATYLDACGPPSIAVASDGSIYAGVSPSVGGIAGVLKFTPPAPAPVSLNQISNAFSGDGGAVAAGGLYSITGTGFQPAWKNLWINPPTDLPKQLEGVQVLFDNIAASILEVEPGRLIITAPASVSSFTSVQISYNGALSNPVWMPVYSSLPGLWTRDFMELQPHGNNFADGYAQNQDGTLNDANHPAAAGSTVFIFASGMGATTPPVDPGSIAQSLSTTPVIPVYASWRAFIFGPNPSESVYTMPGFISAMFQIPLQVPASVIPGDGTVRRVSLGLEFQITPEINHVSSNLIGIYVQ